MNFSGCQFVNKNGAEKVLRAVFMIRKIYLCVRRFTLSCASELTSAALTMAASSPVIFSARRSAVQG